MKNTGIVTVFCIVATSVVFFTKTEMGVATLDEAAKSAKAAYNEIKEVLGKVEKDAENTKSSNFYKWVIFLIVLVGLLSEIFRRIAQSKI